jgi:hypothetical protein
MSTLSLRQKTLVLLLCSLLGVPWAATAAPRKSRATPTAAPAPLTLLARSWSFLQSLWAAEGCDIDPDGRCLKRATPPRPNTDSGCDIDPNGRCHT